MKKCALIVAVAGMATALQAAPIESVTFTNVNSIGRQGNALNEIRTATFSSATGVKNITVTGSLSAAAGRVIWAPCATGSIRRKRWPRCWARSPRP